MIDRNNPVFSYTDQIDLISGARVVASWNEYFMAIAQVTSRKSRDPSTQIGCVIVDQDNQIVATGFNGPCRGMDDNDPDIHQRPAKYDYYEHAERNAIYSAARRGVATKGCKLYLAGKHFCCHQCARAIVQAGIVEVFMTEPDYTSVDYKFDIAMEHLVEAKVRVNTRPA